MLTMVDIEQLTRQFARHQGRLRLLVERLQGAVNVSKRHAMGDIRKAVDDVRNSRAELHLALDLSPSLFERPRTVVIDGIKVGYQKQKGTLAFDDAEKVCQLIRKHFPDMADALIASTHRPVKDALAALPVSDLRRIAVTLTDDTDTVVIKDTSGDIDKLVDALLQEAVPE